MLCIRRCIQLLLFPATSPKKLSNWETISEIPEKAKHESKSKPFEIFQHSPTLKFKLCWTQEPSPPTVERPMPYTKSNDNIEANKENRNICNNNNSIVTENDKLVKRESKVQVLYQFLYNNNLRQQTESCIDFLCPWCSLNCGLLYSLLKHLKLCHARFTFTYVVSRPLK